MWANWMYVSMSIERHLFVEVAVARSCRSHRSAVACVDPLAATAGRAPNSRSPHIPCTHHTLPHTAHTRSTHGTHTGGTPQHSHSTSDTKHSTDCSIAPLPYSATRTISDTQHGPRCAERAADSHRSQCTLLSHSRSQHTAHIPHTHSSTNCHASSTHSSRLRSTAPPSRHIQAHYTRSTASQRSRLRCRSSLLNLLLNSPPALCP